MRAIVRDAYGGPEVLELRDVPTPEPGAGEVLVRVRASSVNTADVDYLRGRPWVARLGTGLRAPRARIPGIDMAGVVDALGPAASRFMVGDGVMADLTNHGSGAWAEHVVVPETALTPLPVDVPLESAACLPSAGILAFQGMRRRLPRPGDRVLVNGASGTVGPIAVKLARSADAEVTATCSTAKMEMVRALGADHVIDYTREDYRDARQRYHLIVDIASRGAMLRIRHLLEPGGSYIVVGGNGPAYIQSILLGPPLTLLTRKRMGLLWWRANDPADMSQLADLLADGSISPLIDRTFDLEATAEAVAHHESGAARGKVVIRT